MTYKVLFVKNRYTKPLNLKQYLDWFSVYTPLSVQTEEISTDFDVTTKVKENVTYHGVICGDDILPKLRTVVPENKYHAVVFVYGNSLDGIEVNATNQGSTTPLYWATDIIQLVQKSDSGKTLNHELFHALIQKANRFGANIVDPMDIYQGKQYYRNDILEVNDGETNRTVALALLAPHWDKVVSLGTVNPTYTYFSQKEVDTFKLQPVLWAVLDKARGLAGTPFIITSGFRTVAQNVAVGGVSNSAHLKGLAADILCTDNVKRSKILYGLLNCGTPLFIEIAKGHLHCDLDFSIHPLGSLIISGDD